LLANTFFLHYVKQAIKSSDFSLLKLDYLQHNLLCEVLAAMSLSLKPTKNKIPRQLPVAIIGMGCLFPKSSGLKAYWRLLFNGEDAITEVPETHWSWKDFFDTDPKKPDHVYCKRGGFVPPLSFDPTEFGIPPSSLEATDTSQLLGLVVAKNALEDAFNETDVAFNRSRTSVILGVTGTQELVIPLGARLGHPIWRSALENSGIDPYKTEEVVRKISDSYVSWQENSFPGLLGNVVAGRISNRLDLGGTNCVVDAACASSMSAIHLAVMELISGKSDTVITGGVDMLNDIFMHMCFSKTMVLSPTGDARPFSQNADGTVLGEGIGLFVLKRLEDAQKDGNRIYAVIKGVGSSSDGKSQSIYAPRAQGQAKALKMAYDEAGIDPFTVELIEAHGTGTKVGDQVEFQALKGLFGQPDNNHRRCALGSVKSMIGHTKAAAGAAGLMKAVLAVYHKVIPPTLKIHEPDPKLNIHKSPFYLNTQSRPWFSKKEHPRRAGVSAFGFGGSNFHVVIEEYQKQKEKIAWDGSKEIIAFSALDQHQLKQDVQRFKTFVDNAPSHEGISAKAAKTRNDFSANDPYRFLLVLEPSNDVIGLLDRAFHALEDNPYQEAWEFENMFYGSPEPSGKMAFIFPGQGSQYVDMGRDLVCFFPDAMNVLERANKTFESTGCLTDHIYPLSAQNKKDWHFQEDTLRKTDIAQPAIGAVSMAMLKILQHFGLQPDAVCGHSFGELSALCAAGWIDLESFLSLAITRGRLMAKTDDSNHQNHGSMLAVKAPLNEIEELIKDTKTDVVLANRNSPIQGVLSGSLDAITRTEEKCREKGFRTVRLPVSAAFHSPLVQHAQKPFSQAIENISILPTDIPVFSNTTGSSYPADPKKAKQLLGDHLLSPVDFVSEIENLFNMGVRTFVEVGPKSVLTGLVKSILEGQNFKAVSLDKFFGKQSGITDLAQTLALVASLGHFVDLSAWEPLDKDVTKQRMSIFLSGVNYRDKKAGGSGVRKQESGVRGQKSEAKKQALENKKQVIKTEQNTSSEQQMINPKHREIRSKNIKNSTSTMKTKQPQNNMMLDALQVLQDGLKSMQALQKQTAETHQKFLETQTQATKTLQHMMESTQRLVERSLGVHPDRIVTHEPSERFEEELSNTQKISTSFNQTHNDLKAPVEERILQTHSDEAVKSDLTKSQYNAAVFKAPDPKPAAKDLTSPDKDQKNIESLLLNTVSQLTGYPVEMLALDMDIEADLGIDSIKRVEILSALEEKMPHLPAVSPDVMGTLKTLGQIVEYLSETPEDTAVSSDTKDVEPAAAGHKKIEGSLLDTVSRLTGYPVEMLALDMDIEADLGIDSIKRVEILSALEEKMPHLPAVSPDVMGTLKTLGQIVEYLAGTSTPQKPEIDTVVSPSASDVEPVRESLELSSQEFSDFSPEYLASNIGRRIVFATKKPFVRKDVLALPLGRTVYVTDDQTGLSQAIVDQFKSQSISAKIIPKDMSFQSVENTPRLTNIGGLIIVAEQVPKDDSLLKHAFSLSKSLGPDLLDSAGKGGAFFATVTRLDGAFGFKGIGIDHPAQGGLAGLAKTAAIEWENVRCRAFDISPLWQDHTGIAKTLVSELLYSDAAESVEVGLDSDSRWILELESLPYAQGEIDLGPKDVVIVTGGARGVTAAAACALAEHAKPTLVLLGRSETPTPEPEWLVGIKDPAAIKKAILDNEFGGSNPTPVQLEKIYKHYMAHREIEKNLETMKKFGADVHYYSVDVQDAATINAILNDVRNTLGPIKGIIHGAGRLADCRIVDKSIEQFETVFNTKVKGLNVLLEATKNDPLKYLVLFSSVTARVGNNGQADYAVANEVLNKMAQKESIQRPDCRVVSINWGPWDGGMVCSALKRKFETSGVDLIPVDAGAMCMVHEMKGRGNLPVEVVIGANILPEKEKDNAKIAESALETRIILNKKENLSMTVQREIDVDRYPILGAHILDGKPVVPFALIAEWLGHGALHENPGLLLHGLDDMRIFQGIKLDKNKKHIRLMAGKTRKKGAAFEVDVQIRDGIKDNIEVIHSGATAILADQLESPPPFNLSAHIGINGYSKTIHEIYKNILFHGVELQGIQEIIGYSSRSITARISSAPSPVKWMKEPLRSRWIADPLVLDSACQMAILWCFEERGMVSLPSYSASYRQYRDAFPSDGVTAVLEIKEATDHKIKGDFTFLDTDEVVVARMTGYEAVMDASLSKAFKPAMRYHLAK
jgi:acyl transferase domain-containing protein/NAD(P)-dependent dehydrogenase (short-subunit alcohol dehydrogenase family)